MDIMEVKFAGAEHKAYLMRGEDRSVLAVAGDFKFGGQVVEDAVLELDTADLSQFTLTKGEEVLKQGTLPRDHELIGPELQAIEGQVRDAERAHMAAARTAEQDRNADAFDRAVMAAEPEIAKSDR